MTTKADEQTHPTEEHDHTPDIYKQFPDGIALETILLVDLRICHGIEEVVQARMNGKERQQVQT